MLNEKSPLSRGSVRALPRSESAVELGRIVRFALVGVLATIVYAAATVFSVEVLLVPAVAASVFGQLAATAISYFGHAIFSFRVQPTRSYLVRFLLTAAFTFGLNIVVTWLLTTALGVSYRISVGVVTVLIPLTNYVCNRFWVFLPGIKASRSAQVCEPLQVCDGR